MSSRLTFNRSSFQRTGSCLLFALLLSAAALTANSAVSGADKPKENAENSGAPDVSYPLDEFLDRCLAQPDHGSTDSQVECTNQARQRCDDEMNQVYRRLADYVGLKTLASLRDAQRRWLQYRDADQLLAPTTHPGTSFVVEEIFGACLLGRSNELISCSSSCGAFYNRSVACSC